MFSLSRFSLVGLSFIPFALAKTYISDCRSMPGDVSWPDQQKWSQLNATVGGRLIATTPVSSVCHGDATYNEAACTELADNWYMAKTHYVYPSEFMAPYWQNQSCDPFTPRDRPCVLGNEFQYSINVSSAADVAAGLRFAEEHNIRIVIKNTGHDYLGKSSGKGGLGLWTHNMKDIAILDYSSHGYVGPAVKIGAGVQIFEAFQAVASQGLRVVGGECATVGFTGGFLQGGGHSALSSTNGMGADQVLEWEVVTADGKHIVATPSQNTDLYWALSGGGPGTYGVVVSATVKAFKDGVVGGAYLSFNSTGISDATYWEAVEEFHASLPNIVDSGATIVYSVLNTTFYLVALTFPGSTEDDVSALLRPWLSKLDTLGVSLGETLQITSYSNYYDHFDHYLGPLPEGNPMINIIDYSLAGRLIPRSVITNPTSNKALTEAFKLSVHPGGGFVTGGVALSASHKVAGNDASTNAVLPAWRDTIVQILAFAPWNMTDTLTNNYAADNYLVDVTVPAFKALAPQGGAYLNEANFAQSDWKEAFYGKNYARLQRIKKKYDPEDLFYARTAVGSDAWEEDGDGRLCRTSYLSTYR